MKKARFSIIIVVIIIACIYPALYYGSSKTTTITITDKERITTGSGNNIDSKYLVYADDEVFECTDSWLFMKFNSSDQYGALKVGDTYTVKVAGWRIPFFSWYRNIIKIKIVKGEKQ